jgi:hypothetical protein
MTVEEALYSPIIPADELKRLVKRLLSNPADPKLLDQISDEILDLFSRHGIDDEKEIVDAVYQTKKELTGSY